jgi:5-methylcytosine-specific restriction endonuclease McrA
MERDSSEFDKVRIPLIDIISGEFKGHYLSSRLRKRLIKDGYKENKCEECGIKEWNGKSLTCELHHIDGNRGNNKLENLLIICPNCHSQTPNHSIRK